MVSFRVGDKAVYPKHGVGIVSAIEEKEIYGTTQKFYVLRILENDMKVMVPASAAQSNGLRKIISSKEVEEVFKVLKDHKNTSTDHHQTWNRRYREYRDKLNSGDVRKIAEVLRDLSILKFHKDLSFSERKTLDNARGLLTKELAIAMRMREDEVGEEIDSCFDV